MQQMQATEISLKDMYIHIEIRDNQKNNNLILANYTCAHIKHGQ